MNSEYGLKLPLSRWLRMALTGVGLVAMAVAATGCGSSSSESSDANVTTPSQVAPRIVVANAILGSLVAEIVGADVITVIVPNGKDPHDYEASAKDVAAIMNADLVIETGLAYDEGLEKSIDAARDKGVRVFTASDHVTLREMDGDHDKDDHDKDSHDKDTHDHDEDDHDKDAHDHDKDDHDHDKDDHDKDHKEDHDHGHDEGDPHFLSDPLTVLQMVPELVKVLESVTQTDLSNEGAALVEALESTHSEVQTVMASLGSTPCVLVTGHESLNYFAARYDCNIVGTIIPSLSSTAEATAGNLARLRKDAQAAGVNAVFVDEATPTNVANQIASEIGVGVYQLPSHSIPDDGQYKSYVLSIANVIVQGLLSE
jgi:zinc/manganese transport system substrate-binding protein